MSQSTNGLISSVYSGAQIVGGVALGSLGDRWLGRRGLLLLSFAGAAVSYAVVGLPGATLKMLIASRVVVGLCKQTMTASTAKMSELTSVGAERALWIGRISTASQLSWIFGQSVGGWLNAHGEPWLVSAVAVGVYAIDAVLVVLMLPRHSTKATPKLRKTRDWRALVSSSSIIAVAAARIASQFASIATNGARMMYELERWNLSRSDLAYFSSFKSMLGLFASWQLAGRLSMVLGFWSIVLGSILARLAASLVEALPGDFWFKCDHADATFLLEKICRDPSLLIYALFLFPINAAAGQLSSIALRSKFTDVVPPDQTAAALGALDLILSIVGIAAPIVGGFVFDHVTLPHHQPLAAATIQFAALLVMVIAAAFVPTPLVPDDDQKTVDIIGVKPCPETKKTK